MAKDSRLLDITQASAMCLIASARDSSPVTGWTHNFYRYPARFSPRFARAAVEAFTEPGDYVLDPYVGGGTSLVEAMVVGRMAVGVDISELAHFVSLVKTTLLADVELKRLGLWVEGLQRIVNMHEPSETLETYARDGYYRHLDHPLRWRLRKAIEQGIGSVSHLGSNRTQAFSRCVVLRTAQWALDGRRKLPSIPEFREMLVRHAREMISAARAFREMAQGYEEQPVVRVLNRSTAGLDRDSRMVSLPAPKLVITSPPYPGIHVLYHRWQVDGRKEAPLPFMIANKLDGSGGSFYTMGDRKSRNLDAYFASVEATMSSVVALSDESTTFVQMVAFSEPQSQLPRYLETMEKLGLTELLLPPLGGEGDGRLWRSVPNRRWYSNQRGVTPGSQEVVLIHRKNLGERSPNFRLPLKTSSAAFAARSNKAVR